MKKIKVFEAFAGYGSQAMALKRLQTAYPDDVEFEYVGTSEIEPNAIAAYKAIHGDTTNFGDITQIDWESVPDFDLFTWSFPCTSVSSAGKQEGLAENSGTSSSLCWECFKAIKTKRPKWLVMENVKALTQKKFAADFESIQLRLEGLGYANFWQVLNAKDYAIPQNRERVFMVSIRIDDEQPTFTFPDKQTLTKCVEDYLQSYDEVGREYYINPEKVTEKILSDILDQPNVRTQFEQLYHDEHQADSY
jgi:DNA (cytosine-5)-methyltransferase 1